MTNISKEQILSLLQDSIMTLKAKGKEFSTNAPLYTAWKNQNAKVQEAIKELDLEDRRFLDVAYAKWSIEVLQADIDASLLIPKDPQD